MQTTTNETVSTKLDLNIDYAKIEVRAVREALAGAKNKTQLIAIAVSIGVLKSKSSNAAKTIRVEPLRQAIEDALRTAEQQASRTGGFPIGKLHEITARETAAQRDARVGVITQAMADDVDGLNRPENAGKHAAPLALFAPRERKRIVLTAEQRANKLARNRRRHKRALARARYGWANGQRTIRGAA